MIAPLHRNTRLLCKSRIYGISAVLERVSGRWRLLRLATLGSNVAHVLALALLSPQARSERLSFVSYVEASAHAVPAHEVAGLGVECGTAAQALVEHLHALPLEVRRHAHERADGHLVVSGCGRRLLAQPGRC